jgi:hypothetical protein
METRETLLNRLNDTATQLRQLYRSLPDPDLPVYELWLAKEILVHLTFWHESFVRNVDDLSHGRKPSPLKVRLRDLNQCGVDLRSRSFPVTNNQSEMLRFLLAD